MVVAHYQWSVQTAAALMAIVFALLMRMVQQNLL
jgi:hypothetical protein